MDKYFVESPRSPQKISKEQLTELLTKAGYLADGEHIRSIWIDHSPISPTIFNIRIGKTITYEYKGLTGIGHQHTKK